MIDTNHDRGASFTTANPVEAPTDIQPTDQASVADKPVPTLDDLLNEFEVSARTAASEREARGKGRTK